MKPSKAATLLIFVISSQNYYNFTVSGLCSTLFGLWEVFLPLRLQTIGCHCSIQGYNSRITRFYPNRRH